MNSVQEALVSDKLALVNVAGWERLKIKSEVQKVQTVKPKQRMQGYEGWQQLHHWSEGLLSLFWPAEHYPFPCSGLAPAKQGSVDFQIGEGALGQCKIAVWIAPG